MKLTQDTMAILKNFSVISEGFKFQPGSMIQTLAQSKAILATAYVAEEFTVEGQFWNLPNFLQILSVFDGPTVEWFSDYLVVRAGKTTFRYAYSDNIASPAPYKELEIESLATFNLSGDDLSEILKMTKIMDSVEMINLKLSPTESSIELQSVSGNSSDKYNKTIEVETDEHIELALSVENMKMLELPYSVIVSNDFVKFSNKDYNLSYAIAASDV